ncbi:MAG TPA: pyridoxal-dependent decarboxylase [Chitinophagaceae bacterium]|nr:pyridoxal-dependent decarboxylase [Chitinophagaceae bacterium]
MYWSKLPNREIKQRVFTALGKNLNYQQQPILGLPATYLDQEQFYFNAPFLKDAAFLSVLIHNPNHIGCHTYSQGETYFRGTQELEVELLKICAEQIFQAAPNDFDGYVAPGGTEANIQAAWMYRNYFMKEHGVAPHEIGLVFSEDVHYSAYKACNLLQISPITIPVDENNRIWKEEDLELALKAANDKGISHFIVILNMGSTMFGSIDDPDLILPIVEQYAKEYWVHVDAAFGGFIYPFTNPDNKLNFKHPKIASATIDGHKMLQAPYGTGIFLCKKNWIHFTQTEEASYVQGTDFTLCGSRSGANAVSMWMILKTHGSQGWTYNLQRLIDRADSICDALDEMNIDYFRDPYMNIVTIKADNIPRAVAENYHLVADDFNNPKWWKIVTMMHVDKPTIDQFLIDLKRKKTAPIASK